jgi:ubiquinone/menaquinone biosynthesis C-methylase UbiE
MTPHLKQRVIPSQPCELDFGWYELIRSRFLTAIVTQSALVLDVGCGSGDILLMLSEQIAQGIGIDISEEAITTADKVRTQRGITNVQFVHDNAVQLSFRAEAFDVTLCLGDVLCYPNLYEHQERVVSEIHRVLRKSGLAVHECMNWDWEYRSDPQWTFFSRREEGRFSFVRVERTPAGSELCHNYQVVADSPLHKWVQEQVWPVSPMTWDVALNIVEEEPIPDGWLRFENTSRHQHYTPAALQQLYQAAGFQRVETVAYGQTYDIINKAGLLDTIAPYQEALATAEAQFAYELHLGSGPWLFALAWK